MHNFVRAFMAKLKVMVLWWITAMAIKKGANASKRNGGMFGYV